MDDQDRAAIERLFERLRQVERQAGPRDAAAEAFIRERIAAQPAAPYYMAQTIVMQRLALEDAGARIEELERQLASAPGSAAGDRLDTGASRASVPRIGAAPASAQPAEPPGGSPWGGRTAETPARGFLAGAAQTAMGVAGGLLLGNFLGSLFAGDAEATAPETPEPETPAPPTDDVAAEDIAPEDDGGDFLDGFFGDGEF